MLRWRRGELVVAGEQVGGEKRWVNVGLTGGDYLNGWGVFILKEVVGWGF